MTDDEQPQQPELTTVKLTTSKARLMLELSFQALLAQGEYRVTDNGDGTYTHEWIAKPRDNGEDSQP